MAWPTGVRRISIPFSAQHNQRTRLARTPFSLHKAFRWPQSLEMTTNAHALVTRWAAPSLLPLHCGRRAIALEPSQSLHIPALDRDAKLSGRSRARRLRSAHHRCYVPGKDCVHRPEGGATIVRDPEIAPDVILPGREGVEVAHEYDTVAVSSEDQFMTTSPTKRSSTQLASEDHRLEGGPPRSIKPPGVPGTENNGEASCWRS
jgi:hypothetical protein